jgi:hypothetical protein
MINDQERVSTCSMNIIVLLSTLEKLNINNRKQCKNNIQDSQDNTNKWYLKWNELKYENIVQQQNSVTAYFRCTVHSEASWHWRKRQVLSSQWYIFEHDLISGLHLSFFFKYFFKLQSLWQVNWVAHYQTMVRMYTCYTCFSIQ